MRPLRAFFALILTLGSPLSWAEPLSVTAQRSVGSATTLVDGARAPLTQGRALQAGTELQTAADARAQLSFAGKPTLDLGANSSLLLHSGDASVLRLRLLQGALHVDAQPGAAAARDIRLNIADLRLRVMNAQAWVQQTESGGQVCLISGRISVQFPTRADELDIPGQCLRRAGVETHWVIVPIEVLTERVALTQISAPAIAARPATDAAAPTSIPSAPITPAAAPLVAVVAPQPAPPIPTPAPTPPVTAASAESPVLAAPKVPVIVLAPPAAEPVMDAAPAAARTASVEAATATVPELPAEPTAESVVVSVAEIPQAEPPAEPASAPEVEIVLATLDAADSSLAADDEADAVQPMAQGDERRWSVVFASMSEAGAAAQEAARLQALGLKAEAREYRVGSRHGFRVGVGRFASREEADAAMNGLLDVHPQLSAWLARY
ncbi:MAG: FecR domain-containing protein [Panacagrimonas sp.]